MRQSLRITLRIIAAVTAFVVAFPAAAIEQRVPNDAYFAEQWYLRKIGAPEAWVKSLGLETVPVAVIDSGVDIDHPDLKENVWRNMGEIGGDGIDNDGNGYVDDIHGWDFVGDDADPRPDAKGEHTTLGTNHGTINAGVIAARGDNGKGIVGVTWQTNIMPLRVLDANGSGDPMRVMRAVEYAVRNGAKVINLSFAGPTYSGDLEIALRRAYDAGVFIVAAAGNAPDGGEAVNLDTRPLYPVCFDRESSENFIYGVAATDDKDRKAEFSNYGAGCIDMAAPGTRILSTQYFIPGDAEFGQPYGGYYNGTSVAAPVVSGVVALIRALDRNLTPKQVMNILTESAVNVDAANPGYFGRIGRGRIDAAKAVERALAQRHGEGVPLVPTVSLAPPGTSRYVVTAPGPGRSSEVRLFTEDGTFIRGFDAFPKGFRGGASLALANFSGAARQSIVVGALAGGSPHVRVFDINSRAIGGFYAYDELFSGGVHVASGDVDGDGKDEIVTGAGPGGGPHVRVFRPNGIAVGGFFAFDPATRGGVEVAAGDVDGDGKAEIVSASAGVVRVFDAKGVRKHEFFPYGNAYRGALGLGVADVDGDGKPEITTVRSQMGKAIASAFRATGTPYADVDLDAPTPSFMAATGGLPSVSAGAAHWFGSPLLDTPTVVGAYIGGNKSPVRFQAYENSFAGGVSAAVTR